MEWWVVLLVSSLLLLVLMILGVPIAYSLGFLALTLGILFTGPRIFYLFGTLAYGKVNSFGLVAVPLFIFMAEMVLVPGPPRTLSRRWTNGFRLFLPVWPLPPKWPAPSLRPCAEQAQPPRL